MKDPRTSRRFAIAAAVLLALTAIAHASGVTGIRALATEAGGDVAVLLPLVWLAVSVDLAALALATALLVRQPHPAARPLLFAFSIIPLGAAALQVVFIGFIAPTAMLLLDGALLVAAALTTPRAAAVTPPHRSTAASPP